MIAIFFVKIFDKIPPIRILTMPNDADPDPHQWYKHLKDL
jgi:hypothetical protein